MKADQIRRAQKARLRLIRLCQISCRKWCRRTYLRVCRRFIAEHLITIMSSINQYLWSIRSSFTDRPANSNTPRATKTLSESKKTMNVRIPSPRRLLAALTWVHPASIVTQNLSSIRRPKTKLKRRKPRKKKSEVLSRKILIRRRQRRLRFTRRRTWRKRWVGCWSKNGFY